MTNHCKLNETATFKAIESEMQALIKPYIQSAANSIKIKCKIRNVIKDQDHESIQSSTTPDGKVTIT